MALPVGGAGRRNAYQRVRWQRQGNDRRLRHFVEIGASSKQSALALYYGGHFTALSHSHSGQRRRREEKMRRRRSRRDDEATFGRQVGATFIITPPRRSEISPPELRR